jgi:hypothetical protein
LVEVVAWLNEHGWTDRAGADAARTCNLAFLLHAELFNRVLEGFENFKGAKRHTAA